MRLAVLASHEGSTLQALIDACAAKDLDASIALVIAASRYIQPVGLFEGTVRPSPTAPARPIKDLLGVTEDHHSLW